jgi:hypothetical protein
VLIAIVAEGYQAVADRCATKRAPTRNTPMRLEHHLNLRNQADIVVRARNSKSARNLANAVNFAATKRNDCLAGEF